MKIQRHHDRVETCRNTRDNLGKKWGCFEEAGVLCLISGPHAGAREAVLRVGFHPENSGRTRKCWKGCVCVTRVCSHAAHISPAAQCGGQS